MHTEEFRNHDDHRYIRWLAHNPNGYVINIQRTHNPRDARLHTAVCKTITGTPARGTTFAGDWVKVCSGSLADLDTWALRNLGAVVRRCPTCEPPGTAAL